MAWLRLDDKFAEHPKLLALGTRGDRWTWLELLLYCARQQKAGVVPGNIGDVLKGATPAFLRRALEVGLLDQQDGQLRIHDFSDYNAATIDERVAAYIDDHPEASATAIAKAIGGRKQLVLGAVKRHSRFRVGSGSVPENQKSVPKAVPREPKREPISGSQIGTARADPSFKESPLSVDVGTNEREDDSDQDQLELDRREAWRRYAEGRADVQNPRAYARKGFDSGEWPPGHEPAKAIDVTVACENWIRGRGWDETFDADAVLEELERVAHSAGEWTLEHQDELLELWRTVRAERYPEVAA